ncbi:MAG: FAD-dependent thymidylate synthase [Lachnospiraceae bacterium]
MKIVPASIEIISTEPYEEMLKRVERAGRVCYKSEGSIEDGSAERFIRNILKRGHESVIEHAGITVKVTCDRGVTHEIVRHRLASYSQESTRYCNYSKDKFENQISCIDIANGFSYDLNKEEDRQKYLLWQGGHGIRRKILLQNAGAWSPGRRSQKHPPELPEDRNRHDHGPS